MARRLPGRGLRQMRAEIPTLLELHEPPDISWFNALNSHTRGHAQLGEVTSLSVTELGLEPSSPNT